jgi:hypothetical protein
MRRLRCLPRAYACHSALIGCATDPDIALPRRHIDRMALLASAATAASGGVAGIRLRLISLDLPPSGKAWEIRDPRHFSLGRSLR